MFDRFVSVFSLLVVIAAAVFFGISAWRDFIGAVSEGESTLIAGGWLMAGLIYACVAADPKHVDPVSIVKR